MTICESCWRRLFYSIMHSIKVAFILCFDVIYILICVEYIINERHKSNLWKYVFTWKCPYDCIFNNFAYIPEIVHYYFWADFRSSNHKSGSSNIRVIIHISSVSVNCKICHSKLHTHLYEINSVIKLLLVRSWCNLYWKRRLKCCN